MNADMTLGKSRAGYTARRDRGLLDGAVIREGLRRTGTLAVIMGIVVWVSALLVPIMRGGYDPENPLLLGPVQANPMILLCFTVFAPFLTMKAFDFLNSRAGSDLFHSWPVKRRTVAAGFLAAVALWLVFIIGVSMLVSMASCGLLTDSVRLDTSLAGIFFLQMLAASILVEMSVFLAMTVTGTTLSNIVTALGLIFLPRFLVTAAGFMLTDRVLMLSQEHLPLFFTNRLNVVTGIVFEYGLTGIFGTGRERVLYFAPSVLYTFVLAAVYAVIGCILFVRRPSETAGRPALGEKLQCATRIGIGFLITVPAASAIGGDYAYWGMSEYATMLALFLAGFGATFVYEYLSARRLLSCRQFLAGILAILLLDAVWAGAGLLAGKLYARERISADQIESVSFAEESTYPLSLGLDYGKEISQDYWGAKIRGALFTDEEIIQLVALRHEQTAQGSDIRNEVEILDETETIQEPEYEEAFDAYSGEAENWVMDTRIRLRNGKEIYRNLRFTLRDIRMIWKKAVPQIGSSFLEIPEWNELQNIYTGNKFSTEFYGWELHEVYETFRSELSEKTPEEWYRILVDGDSYNGETVEFSMLSDGYWRHGVLPVTEDFPETQKLLAEMRSHSDMPDAGRAQTETEMETEAGGQTEAETENGGQAEAKPEPGSEAQTEAAQTASKQKAA